MSTVCSQIVLKCLCLARIGRPDIFVVCEQTCSCGHKRQSCDKRLARLISYIHHTSEYRQYCYVGNTAQQCRLGLFAGDLNNGKSTSGGILCIFGSHTFVPISWTHSSTEVEIISLDAGLRMDGIPALDLSDLVIEVFHSSPNQTNKTKGVRKPRENLSANTQPNMRKQIPITHTNLDLTNIDHVPSSETHIGCNAMLYVFEDNEAVIKNDWQRSKSHDEICFTDPQSCSGLVA